MTKAEILSAMKREGLLPNGISMQVDNGQLVVAKVAGKWRLVMADKNSLANG